jgi:maltooligosyltrehalose trehalohydrolase
MKSHHDMPFGTRLTPEGAEFRLWAPSQAVITLQIEGLADRPMLRQPDGWHTAQVTEATAQTRYAFKTANGLSFPDPASRFNPDDVHQPSQVTDPTAYTWEDQAWKGRPWHEAVIYELHIGSFTPEGSYAAATQKLDDLVALGITAIELMPLADFPGRQGWGYDGVLPYAPDAIYGHPDELKQLVDTAHAKGLMVLLDVVYNHFGPEGNYLHGVVPEFFNAAHQTPWGAAINFDGPGNRTVRDFFVHNALYWVEEFHFDGLRMDAVHAIRDDSALHICTEIGQALRNGPGLLRAVHLVLENDLNQARLLQRDAAGWPLTADAQWNDDLHHAAHVLLTGETDGYYADYAEEPLQRLGRALAEGFVYQGEPSALRHGEARGEPSAELPGTAFVSFLQNHDQIGNRAFGERLPALVSDAAKLDAAYACLLLSPHVPMLFMGEEWAASTPFLYFCDFGPELARAVSTGRREEFKRFAVFQDEAARARIPDPNDRSTFEACMLRWGERAASPHRERLAWITRLLQLRRDALLPHLPAPHGGQWAVESGRLQLMWTLADGTRWHVEANFGHDAAVPTSTQGHTLLLHHATHDMLQAGGVRVALELFAPCNGPDA